MRRDTSNANQRANKLLTSSSKPNAPRLLPMPPDADVDMGTLDDSGISLSLILSKNDMMGDGFEQEALMNFENRERIGVNEEWKG